MKVMRTRKMAPTHLDFLPTLLEGVAHQVGLYDQYHREGRAQGTVGRGGGAPSPLYLSEQLRALRNLANGYASWGKRKGRFPV